jgi:hypothetical protein
MLAHWTRYWSEYIVLWIQILIAIGVSGAFAMAPRFGERFFRSIEHFFSSASAKKTSAILFIFLMTIIVRLALLPVIGIPFPDSHDEHSYLLMAEMFSHGHLAYPPHLLWKSFETFHVNFAPTYSSMYPPAQGAILALGDLLGHPWIGVVLSVAAMCAAILWMLQAWMPSRWALLGAIIAFCNLGIISYWINSYWGGAAAAIGGAMVLGALPRIFRAQKIRYSVVLGLGIAILANSRPYEGLLLCVPAGVWLLKWLIGKKSPPWRCTARRVVLPVFAILCLTGAFMGYYNWRLTGNALVMPHSLNFRTYYRTGIFLWQQRKPPIHYRNRQFEDFYNGWARSQYDGSWRAAIRSFREKVRMLTAAFLWPGCLPALFCLPLVLRDTRLRLLLVELGFCLFGIFCVVYSLPHYAAPLTCVFFGLLVQGFRHLRVMTHKGKSVGVGLTRASMVLLFATTTFNIVHLIRFPAHPYPWSCDRGGGVSATARIEDQLDRIPGQQLVVVRYSTHHNPHGEWVFNHADIDASRIVWARELDQEQNAKLFAYFKDRHIWLFEPDDDPQKLIPYPIPPHP